MPRAFVGFILFMLFTAAQAGAQSPAPAPTFADRWGVIASVVPQWSVPGGNSPVAKLAQLSLDSADLGMDLKASDFRIGVARGGYLRGEWGLSLVRRSFANGGKQGAIASDCSPSGGCAPYGVEYTYNNTSLTGLEASKFVPFGTIARRVQIGGDVAIGVGWYRGMVTRREAETTFVFQGAGPAVPVTTFDTTQVPATQVSKLDPTLLGRLEIAGAVIVTPNAKVRLSGGLNYPGVHSVSVSVLYFFGKP